MNSFINLYKDSVGRTQLSKLLGLILFIILIFYLSFWYTFFLGQNYFNQFATKITSLRVTVISLLIFITALFLAYSILSISIIIANQKSRRIPYTVYKRKGSATFKNLIAPFSSVMVIFLFLSHILDLFFTLTAPKPFMNGVYSGFYGAIFNKFSDPLQSTIYIIGSILFAVHLAYAVESFLQSFGRRKKNNISLIQNVSIGFAFIMAFACSALPLHVLIVNLSF